MTSEDKYVLSQLTNETGNLKGILKQQNIIYVRCCFFIRYAYRVKRTELKKRFGTFRKTIPLRFLLGKG